MSAIGIALLEVLLSCFAGSESMKRALHLICGTAMAVLILSSVEGFDYAPYALAISRTDANHIWSAEAASDTAKTLDRRLIETRCRAYILDKAEAYGVSLIDAAVSLSWATDGYWYPTGALLCVPAGQGRNKMIETMLTGDLGIPPEAQEWRETD